jgi:hypothetical protein
MEWLASLQSTTCVAGSLGSECRRKIRLTGNMTSVAAPNTITVMFKRDRPAMIPYTSGARTVPVSLVV